MEGGPTTPGLGDLLRIVANCQLLTNWDDPPSTLNATHTRGKKALIRSY